MALTTSQNKNTGSQQQPQNNQPQQNQTSQNSTPDLFADDFVNFAGQSNADAGKAIEELTRLAEDQAKAGKDPFGIKYMLVDDEAAAGLPFIIAYNTRGNHNRAFFFLLEAGLYDGIPQNEIETINGHRIEIDNDVSKYYDNVLASLGLKQLNTIAKIDAQPVGYMVVKSEMDITQVSYLERLHGTAFSAIKEEQGLPSATIRHVVDNGYVSRITHDIHPGQNIEDLEGNPIAADFTSTLSITAGNVGAQGRNKSANTRGRSLVLAKVAGQLDFVFAPDRMPTQVPGSQYGWCKCVDPLLIMTDCTAVDASTKTAKESPETILWGLLAMGQVAENGNYADILRRGGEKASLGNLGYVWEPAPTPSVEFNPREIEMVTTLQGRKGDALTLEELSERFIRPTMSVAMDIRKGSRNNYTQEIYRQAALGNKKANEVLFDMFDQHLDGNFAKYWDRKAPIMQRGIVAVHAGTYRGADNEPRDVRDFDFLRLANLYGKSAATSMVSYARTMELGASDGDQGLINIDERRKVLQQLTQFDCRGLYDRVFFAPDLLIAVLQAASEGGLHPQATGLYDMQGTAYYGGSGFKAGGQVETGGLYDTYGGTTGAGTAGGYHHRGFQRKY